VTGGRPPRRTSRLSSEGESTLDSEGTGRLSLGTLTDGFLEPVLEDETFPDGEGAGIPLRGLLESGSWENGDILEGVRVG
jgi:hypothetical protein